ncbi:hypothetical protein, partial [Novipirellula sp.]|uniref:hypothetical protein n=1 Tax=Novipirellula sp. TaxID=2795430 RepID=UPI0035638BEB
MAEGFTEARLRRILKPDFGAIVVGTGAISTIDFIGEDPATVPLLNSMLNEEGKPKICERVWISSLNGKYRTTGGEGFGKLSP